LSRILIIRTSSLGDVVQALPVLTALRRHLPQARIAWLIEDVFAPLLDGHPDLDEIITVRLRAWRKQPFSLHTLRQLADFYGALDRFAPEVVLDLMGNHKAGFLAALTLADHRIGAERAFRREPSSAIWLSESALPVSRHSVDKMLAVLDPLGLPHEPAEFGGERLPALQNSDLASPEPGIARVLIHPGAGWDNKRYPPERWGEVARLMREASGSVCGIIVGHGEESLVEAAVAASGGAAEAVTAPDLPHLTRVLSQASLVMGGDTGPLHLAHALGRPVLCLMGPTDPESCGPYRAAERTIWRQLPCSFCHKRYTRTMPCIAAIPPAVIADRARRLLDGQPLPEKGPIEQGEAGCLILH
jgi:heptosyltransferase-1